MEEHTAILDGHSSQTSDVQVTPRYKRQLEHIKTQATTPLDTSEHIPLLFIPLIRSWNYIWQYRVHILLVVLVVLLIYIVAKPGCRIKGKFMNRSSSGFYYDTEDLSFHTPQDRDLAVKALLGQLNSDGSTYTSEQISSLSSSFIIMILEPEDEDDQKMLKARVTILVDPTYKAVFTSVEKARRNNNTFASNQERVVLYSLLVKYFDSLVKYVGSTQSPLTVSLDKWTDILLIRTFKTLQLPASTEYLP